MEFCEPTHASASTSILISAAIWELYWVPLRYLEGVSVAEAYTAVLIDLPTFAIISITFLHNLEYADRILLDP